MQYLQSGQDDHTLLPEGLQHEVSLQVLISATTADTAERLDLRIQYYVINRCYGIRSLRWCIGHGQGVHYCSLQRSSSRPLVKDRVLQCSSSSIKPFTNSETDAFLPLDFIPEQMSNQPWFSQGSFAELGRNVARMADH